MQKDKSDWTMGVPPWLKESYHARGLTALHYAARNGHTAIIEELLSERWERSTGNADRERTDEANRTAAHWAAYRGHLEALKALKRTHARMAVHLCMHKSR